MVKQQGGVFIAHVYVNRGRMTEQMNTKAFIDTIKAKMLN